MCFALRRLAFLVWSNPRAGAWVWGEIDPCALLHIASLSLFGQVSVRLCRVGLEQNLILPPYSERSSLSG